MPRIRSIKPTFFSSDDVAALSLRARLTWIGLWTYCDDHGRGKDNVKLIKAAVWPLDELSLQDVADDLDELTKHKRIVRYGTDPQLLAVTTWHFHQSVNRPGKSTFPPPPRGSVSVPEPGEGGHCARCFRESDIPGGLTEDSRTLPGATKDVSPGQPGHGSISEPEMQSREGSRTTHGALTSGKERNGTEIDTPSFGGGVSISHVQTARARDSERSVSPRRTPRPARRDVRCVEHEHDDNPPRCGACLRAQREADTAAREQQIAARHADLRAGTDDRRRAIDACSMCDHDGYLDSGLCGHDPAAAERAQRGRAAVNAAMGWTTDPRNRPEAPATQDTTERSAES